MADVIGRSERTEAPTYQPQHRNRLKCLPPDWPRTIAQPRIAHPDKRSSLGEATVISLCISVVYYPLAVERAPVKDGQPSLATCKGIATVTKALAMRAVRLCHAESSCVSIRESISTNTNTNTNTVLQMSKRRHAFSCGGINGIDPREAQHCERGDAGGALVSPARTSCYSQTFDVSFE